MVHAAETTHGAGRREQYRKNEETASRALTKENEDAISEIIDLDKMDLENDRRRQ